MFVSRIDGRVAWKYLGFKQDGMHWVPGESTPDWVTEYLSQFKPPNRYYNPMGYIRNLRTKQFAKLLLGKDKSLAEQIGISHADFEVPKPKKAGLEKRAQNKRNQYRKYKKRFVGYDDSLKGFWDKTNEK